MSDGEDLLASDFFDDFNDFDTPRSTNSSSSSQNQMLKISRFSDQVVEPLPRLTGALSDGSIRVPSIKVQSVKLRIRKSGVLEIRSNMLWKTRLVVLEEDMLVVYPIPSDGSDVPDTDALFEFYLGYPHESLDLVKSITVTFNDSRGYQTVKLSSTSTSRVFKLISSDISLSLRASDTRIKKEWFDLISSVRIKSLSKTTTTNIIMNDEDDDETSDNVYWSYGY